VVGRLDLDGTVVERFGGSFALDLVAVAARHARLVVQIATALMTERKTAPSPLRSHWQAPCRARRRFARAIVEGAGLIFDLHDDGRGDVEAHRACRRLKAEIRMADMTRHPSACAARFRTKARKIVIVIEHDSFLCVEAGSGEAPAAEAKAQAFAFQIARVDE